MFKKLRYAWSRLLTAIDRVSTRLEKLADELEAEEPAKKPPETNGQHTEGRQTARTRK